METGVDAALLDRFVPINALGADNRASIARKATLIQAAAGDYLFKAGEPASQALFLLDGQVALEEPNGASTVVKAGEPAAAHRLSHQSPRKHSGRCVSAVRCVAVDPAMLDVMLTWEQTGKFEVNEIDEQAEIDSDDWMTRLLHMRLFQMVPPSNLQATFMRMQPMDSKPGDIIIKQGDEGDYFYVLIAGRCMVTREIPNQKPARLAELEAGACFGEEALISNDRRNATITMLTAGKLMRLSKADFKTLLNDPLSRRLDLAGAQKMVAEGRATWLDVRLPSEYQLHHLPGSVNVPLYMLRMKLSTLDPKRSYVVYCDTGRRSSVAAFVLVQKGFDAFVLDRGWSGPAGG
jgi:CRP-like cAMP-binding protein